MKRLTQYKKKVIWLCTLASAFIIMPLLTACNGFNLATNWKNNASLALSINATGSPASYKITGSGPNGESFSQKSTHSSTNISGLASGNWTVNVVANDASDQAIGQGSGQTNLNPGNQATLNITVSASGNPVANGIDLNETNTGVPAGHVLADVGSTITVTESWISSVNGGSRVLQDKNFLSGAALDIEVNGFTVQYCKFNGAGGLTSGSGQGSNIQVLYCEFDGNNENLGGSCALNAAVSLVERVHIHRWPRSMMIGYNNVTVQECYMHDLTCDNSGTHIENIYVAGGQNLTFIRNKLVSNATYIGNGTGQISASLAIYNEGWAPFPDLANIVVQDNYFEGDCGYALYGGACIGKLPKPYATNMTVSGNIFGRNLHRSCGIFGPATSFNNSDPSNVWQNNTWGANGPYWQAGDPNEGDTVTGPSPS